MKIKYTLQGSKRVIIVGNTLITLNKGDNEVQISKQDFAKIKQDFDRYVSIGILQYEAEEACEPQNVDDQKTLKQNLLKQCKEFGIPIANTMTPEVLQGLINKHTEQIKSQDNPLPVQNDTGNNPSNS